MDNNEAILDELRKIREAVQAKPPAPVPKGFVNEFRDFLSKYKVMGLAVAFILGLYLGGLVKALVDDLVMPIIQYAIPGLESVSDWKAGNFLIGDFTAALITFLLVALVIFILVKVTKRMKIE